MYKNSQFWIRFLLFCSAMILIAGRLAAQSAAPITFDALPRANKPDTVVVATPRSTDSRANELPRRDLVTGLRQRIASQKDSIDKLNRAVATATLFTVQPTVVRVDTVQVVKLLVDTIERVSAPAPASRPTPASAATGFAPPTVSGLLQILVSGGDSALRSTYRIRRAEVKVVSDLGRRAQATLMIDVAKALSLNTSGAQPAVTQSSRVLQDAILSVPVGRVQIEAGQQRLPLGYEGSFSSSTLETIERALMESDRARGASFGDVRDLGVAARGKWRWLDYRGGVFNGSGETMNETDRNVGKAVVGQLGFRPAFVKGLRLGGSGATSGAATADKPMRDRYGVDLLYSRGRALLQAEAMKGRDGSIRRAGMYALSGIQVLKTVKVVARFDAWDPDVRSENVAADVTERDYLAGLTWLPSGTRLKAQLAVLRKTYSRDITPAITQLLTQLQASW